MTNGLSTAAMVAGMVVALMAGAAGLAWVGAGVIRAGWRWALRRRIRLAQDRASCVACGEAGGQPGGIPLMALVRRPGERNVWVHGSRECHARGMRMLRRAMGRVITTEAVTAQAFR